MQILQDIYSSMDVFSADNHRLGAVSQVMGSIILVSH
jgi:hypothetical protein